MEFFNSKEDVLEIKLTQYGKFIYSKGKFKPTYYAFMDDDILYDGITDFTSLDQIDINKLENWLNKRIGGHHGGGTCKMALPSDPLGVVGQTGKVYGIEGLRVCDMSIVPISIRWPNSNVYPIAEKIAFSILNGL